MSKRNKITIITPESEALKRLRYKSELSLRDLSERMSYSFSRIYQIESGKENISEAYIKKFLSALEISWEEWNLELEGSDEFYELRQKCKKLVDEIEPKKLELLYGLLGSFCLNKN